MGSLSKYAGTAIVCSLLLPGFAGMPEISPGLSAQGRNAHDISKSMNRLAVREAQPGAAGPDAATPNSKAKKEASESAANGGAPDAALVQKTFQIDVTLGDGRQLKGKIRVRVPERLSIVHTVDGIQYRKIVRPEEIRAIKFKRWRGRLVRQQETGQIFQFDVDRYALELTNGQILNRDGELFRFLTQFVLENENGSVQLFSFWGDLQKKDGSWFTGMKGPSTSRVACHKDVIQRIEFNET